LGEPNYLFVLGDSLACAALTSTNKEVDIEVHLLMLLVAVIRDYI